MFLNASHKCLISRTGLCSNKVMRNYLLALSVLLLLSTSVFAQDVLVLQQQSILPAGESAVTKQNLFDQAVEVLSLENVKSMIGQERSERNNALIENKITKNAGRYMLSMRGDNYARQGE